MALGLNTTEFVYTAAMYMELNGETPSSERLMELIGEIERGSITGRLLGSGTVAIGSLYCDNASIQRHSDKHREDQYHPDAEILAQGRPDNDMDFRKLQ